MASNEGGVRPNGRVPKYRTSCDNCQTAKVKCGHEKPSCRRCSVHRVDCVYSLSRRMGRPRAKKVVLDDSNRRLPASTERDKTEIPKPITPEAEVADDEPPTLTADSPVEESESSEPPVSDPEQLPDTWVPLFGDLGQLDGTEDANQHDHTSQPEEGSMEFLSAESPMELVEIAGLAGMPSFLDGLSSSFEPQAPVSATPGCLFGPHEVLSFALPTANAKSNENGLLPTYQPQSAFPPESCKCQNSTNPSGNELMSISGIGGQPSQLIHFSPTLFQDAIYSPQEVSSSSPSNASQPGDSSSSFRPSSDGASDLSWRRTQVALGQGECGCTDSISQRIASLKAEQQSLSFMPMDCVLMLEKEVEESLALLHKCKNCRLDSIAHLLALISVRMMLDILQKSARSDFVSKLKPSEDNSYDGVALCIGSFKVPARVRFRFLRKALQARFHKLAALIEERERLITGKKQDSFSKSASLLLGDISRGLRTIMGWIELWNAKQS